MLESDENGISLYFGTSKNPNDTKNSNAEFLSQTFCGIYGGSECKPCKESPLTKELKYSKAMLGLPALKRDSDKSYKQSLEKILFPMQGKRFRILIVAESYPLPILQEIIANIQELGNEVHKIAKVSLNYSQNRSLALSETTSESYTQGESFTQGESYSYSESEGTSKQAMLPKILKIGAMALDEGYYKIPPRIETKIPPQDNWDELSKALNKDCFKMPPNKETEISQNNWGRLQEVLQDKDYRIPEFDGKYYFHDGRTDTLTEEIKRQFPKINEAQINKLKGDIAENLMDTYFLKNGWKKLEGEVGCNGIDGLYVKFDKEGNITQVMVVESKYGTSQLGKTQSGTQMSKEWLLKKLDDLIQKNPDNPHYKQIKEKIQNDDYRARLFRVDEKDSTLTISIQKIESKDETIQVSEVNGKDSYKINKIPPINLENQEGSFQQQVADTYNKSKEEVLTQYKQTQSTLNQKETK